ncbi:MAG TPA: hypothetical protein VLW25_10015 [Bryobacteraceae bacterium]|nr:hypothetical protein [Bryobacteraceae bacterium]
MSKVQFSPWIFLAMAWTAGAQPSSGDPWPREFDHANAHFVVYQLQVDSWKDNRLLARSAVSVTRPGQTVPVYGIVSLSAQTSVDNETRTVLLDNLKVTGATFPAAQPRQSELADAIRQSLPDWPRTISLDRLLADLAITQAQTSTESVQLNNQPPKIIYSRVPAALILIDGEPVFRPVATTAYTRVINTPALLLFDPQHNRFYLDGVQWWMTAASLTGPWTVAPAPPADLEQAKTIALEGEEKDPHAHPQDQPQLPPAVVYVSTTPAELIVTEGDPQFSPISGTQLVYVTNTDRDIFMDVKSQNYYVLLAGRWFQAKSLQGSWTFVPGSALPPDFAKIPPASPKGYVLASVPNTEQAREAVIANQIPQTAAVRRDQAKLDVRYDGEPKFQPIPGTSMEYAVNSSTEVIYTQNRYWACQNGVWFDSDSPLGPWELAENIPPEIYTIPPTSPLYHLRYVYTYGCSPDYVYYGYTPGYLGAFVYDGTVVFGTGWWYPGWYGDWWFGWPWTWGFGFQFSYWGGGWFWRPVGPYWWYHHPWYVGRVYSEHWNTHWHPGDREWVRNNVNVYHRWPAATVVSREQAARTSVARPSVGARAPGDVYAGRNGQIYQHRNDGWYQQNRSGQWTRTAPNPGLEQERQSRSLGQSRQGEFQNRGQAPGIPHTVAPPRMSAPRSAPSGGGHHR